ncbi:hypothetical protein [Phytoactinopolyspora mesophila]|nr:hypothetical protein [Phytoactinopolyspora mesophila]
MAMAAVTVLTLAACGSGDEPAGLDATEPSTAEPTAPAAEPETTDSPEPTADPTEDPTSDDPTPVATFTQPHLPQENIVELREVIPITPPDEVSDEEMEVIEAYGRFEASWEQILWGVPPEDSGIEDAAIDPNLSRIRDYAEESVETERVSTGPPSSIVALSVDVNGDEATLEACIDTRGWFTGTAGSMPNESEPYYLSVPTLRLIDGVWYTADTDIGPDKDTCEEYFE